MSLPLPPEPRQVVIFDSTSPTGFRWVTMPIFIGFNKITVSPTQPLNPTNYDIWVKPIGF